MLSLANQFVARATLSWFNGADRRLASYGGPLGGDVEALAERLSARLGAPVRLEMQPV
jgi:hypothetical protein